VGQVLGEGVTELLRESDDVEGAFSWKEAKSSFPSKTWTQEDLLSAEMSCCLTLFELSVASVAKVLATPQPRDRKSQTNILQRRLLKSIPLLEHKLVLEIFSSLLKEKALSQRVLR